MPLLKFILNIGFLSAFLLAPAIFILAIWYRRTFTNILMMWRTPESVFATIAYLIQSLIWVIIGTSFFFNYLTAKAAGNPQPAQNMEIVLLCVSLFVSSSILFLAARSLFVQVITHKGIIVNHLLLRIPHLKQLIPWNHLSDYYVHNDYPNVVFHIIYTKEDGSFDRMTMNVPNHLHVHIKDLLDSKLDGMEGIPAYFGNKKKGIID